MHAMDERVADRSAGVPEDGQRVVGLIGGTGPLGRGLALRLAQAGHQVRIGSRDEVRAQTCAAALPPAVVGVSNTSACEADVVLVTVPWSAHDEILAALAPALEGRVVVDCVNPLGFDENGPFALKVAAGSAAERAKELLSTSHVVAAFHHVSADLLLSQAALDIDVLVVGDDHDAVERTVALVDSMAGLRGVFAGRLRSAGQVEALTANLIAINRRYRVHSGVRVTGLTSPDR
jgi:NADPH-dependent F420 reductase